MEERAFSLQPDSESRGGGEEFGASTTIEFQLALIAMKERMRQAATTSGKGGGEEAVSSIDKQ